jgi:glycosyltransferase involved in cell wall biosynthesis
VVVVDDGSTDGTYDHLVQHYLDHPEVRVLRQARRGVSAARNRGIRASKGDWIALLDSDDEWRPRKLECQLEALEDQPEFRISHTDEIWIRRGSRVNPKAKHAKTGGWIFSRCLAMCVISPSSVLLHRSLLEEVGLFDEELPACEDYDLWLRICSEHPVLYIDEQLVVKYGGHADQLSRTTWGLDRFRIVALEKLLTSESLGPAQRQEVLSTLMAKIEIFAAGAAKRGKSDEVDRLREKQSRWASSFEGLVEVDG